jgi:hypothetical protein
LAKNGVFPEILTVEKKFFTPFVVILDFRPISHSVVHVESTLIKFPLGYDFLAITHLVRPRKVNSSLKTALMAVA